MFWPPSQPLSPPPPQANSYPTVPRAPLRPVLGWACSKREGRFLGFVEPQSEAAFRGRRQSWVISQPDPLPVSSRGCQVEHQNADGRAGIAPGSGPPLSRSFSPTSIWLTHPSLACTLQHQAQNAHCFTSSPLSSFICTTAQRGSWAKDTGPRLESVSRKLPAMRGDR